MWQGPIDIGPGPSRPVTDYSQSFTFNLVGGDAVRITHGFNTTWVSILYVINGQKGGNVIAELTNGGGSDSSGASFAGLNTVTILNYHKVNISPGDEHPDDPFTQGRINAVVKGPGTYHVGFNDGHGPVDNAYVDIVVQNTSGTVLQVF